MWVINLQSNTRDDQYGSSPERRARIILDIIYQIRKAVSKSFCVGIKLNSADQDSTGFEDTMVQISLFVDAGVFLAEVMKTQRYDT